MARHRGAQSCAVSGSNRTHWVPAHSLMYNTQDVKGNAHPLPSSAAALLLCFRRSGGGGAARRLHIAPRWLGRPGGPRHDVESDACLPSHLQHIDLSAQQQRSSRKSFHRQDQAQAPEKQCRGGPAEEVPCPVPDRGGSAGYCCRPSPLVRSLEAMLVVEAARVGAAGLEVQVLALCRSRAAWDEGLCRWCEAGHS